MSPLQSPRFSWWNSSTYFNILFLQAKLQKGSDSHLFAFHSSEPSAPFSAERWKLFFAFHLPSKKSGCQQHWMHAVVCGCRKEAIRGQNVLTFILAAHLETKRKCEQTSRCSTYTMKSSMSMDLALFSQNFTSCKTLSIFWLMLKSAGTSCQDGAQDVRLK